MRSFRVQRTRNRCKPIVDIGWLSVIRLCYSNPIIGFCIEKWWNLRLDSPDSLDTYLSKRFRRGSINSDLLWSPSGQSIILNSFNSIVHRCASNWRLYSCIRTRKDRDARLIHGYIEIGNIFKKFFDSYKFRWWTNIWTRIF